MIQILLSLLAGGLSVLSPCVLPLLPLVLAGAASRSRYGPFIFSAALALSSAAFGLAVASLGRAMLIEPASLRVGAGMLLVGMGLLMLSKWLQGRVAMAMAPIVQNAGVGAARAEQSGLAGQALAGALTGLVWSPCAGPSLGAAIGLATQASSFALASLMMLAFGIGAALPMLLLALGLRSGLAVARRNALLRMAEPLRLMAATTFVAIGVLTATGVDRLLETQLIAWSPDWLTQLTTSY